VNKANVRGRRGKEKEGGKKKKKKNNNNNKFNTSRLITQS